MKMWKRVIVPLLFVCICLAAEGTAFGAEEAADDDTVAEGVLIEGIDIGGMTVEQARTAVEDYIDGLRTSQIRISFNGEESSIRLEEMNFVWNNTDVVEEAAVLGTRGNVLERYKTVRTLENETLTFDLDYTWDESVLDSFLQEEAEKRQTEPVEATLKREGKKFVITESVTGVTVDVASTMQKIRESLNEDWRGGDVEIEAVAEVVEPKFSTEMAESVQDILGEYKTNYNTSETDRSTNLRVGAGYIDGVVLLPGESLSFFDYLYPCTTARGYRGATAYQGGRYVDSIGGGICQVSTTCYNAVLLAELEVVERSPHTMTVSYVKPGLDSGQAQSSGRNLVFANNTDYPVYVEAYASGGTLYIGLWGKETRPANRKVEYYSKYTEEYTYGDVENITYDPNLPYGYRDVTQRAYPKVVAMAYKRVLVDGKVVSDEPLYKDYDRYRATPNYVTIGTGGLSVEEYLAGQQPEGEGEGGDDQSHEEEQPPETQPPTEAPTEPATEAPTEPPTEAPTEPPTEAPTEPPTEAPTEAPTDPPAEVPAEPDSQG